MNESWNFPINEMLLLIHDLNSLRDLLLCPSARSTKTAYQLVWIVSKMMSKKMNALDDTNH